jgi:hypothetical protein
MRGSPRGLKQLGASEVRLRAGVRMPEFSESERHLILSALWNYKLTMTQLGTEHTEEQALPVAMRRLDELNTLVETLGGRPDLPFFGIDEPGTGL